MFNLFFSKYSPDAFKRLPTNIFPDTNCSDSITCWLTHIPHSSRTSLITIATSTYSFSSRPDWHASCRTCPPTVTRLLRPPTRRLPNNKLDRRTSAAATDIYRHRSAGRRSRAPTKVSCRTPCWTWRRGAARTRSPSPMCPTPTCCRSRGTESDESKSHFPLLLLLLLLAAPTLTVGSLWQK